MRGGRGLGLGLGLGLAVWCCAVHCVWSFDEWSPACCVLTDPDTSVFSMCDVGLALCGADNTTQACAYLAAACAFPSHLVGPSLEAWASANETSVQAALQWTLDTQYRARYVATAASQATAQQLACSSLTNGVAAATSGLCFEYLTNHTLCCAPLSLEPSALCDLMSAVCADNATAVYCAPSDAHVVNQCVLGSGEFEVWTTSNVVLGRRYEAERRAIGARACGSSRLVARLVTNDARVAQGGGDVGVCFVPASPSPSPTLSLTSSPSITPSRAPTPSASPEPDTGVIERWWGVSVVGLVLVGLVCVCTGWRRLVKRRKGQAKPPVQLPPNLQHGSFGPVRAIGDSQSHVQTSSSPPSLPSMPSAPSFRQSANAQSFGPEHPVSFASQGNLGEYEMQGYGHASDNVPQAHAFPLSGAWHEGYVGGGGGSAVGPMSWGAPSGAMASEVNGTAGGWGVQYDYGPQAYAQPPMPPPNPHMYPAPHPYHGAPLAAPPMPPVPWVQQQPPPFGMQQGSDASSSGGSPVWEHGVPPQPQGSDEQSDGDDGDDRYNTS